MERLLYLLIYLLYNNLVFITTDDFRYFSNAAIKNEGDNRRGLNFSKIERNNERNAIFVLIKF